jgi:hypothetical protein
VVALRAYRKAVADLNPATVFHWISSRLTRNRLEGPFRPHRHATVPGPGPLVATPKPAKVKRDAPRSVTRIAEIEKAIALGNELLELRSKAKWNNEFG